MFHLRELAVLIITTATSLVLILLAFVVIPEPTSDEIVSRVQKQTEDSVIAEWERFRRNKIAFAGTPELEWPERESPLPIETEETLSSNLTDLILSECDRLVIDHRAEDSFGLIDEYLKRSLEPGDVGKVHLRGVQISVRLSLKDRVESHLRNLFESSPLTHEFARGALCARGLFDDPRYQEALCDSVIAGRFGYSLEGEGIEVVDSRVEISLGPSWDYFLEALDSCVDVDRRSSLGTLRNRLIREVIRRRVGDIESQVDENKWHPQFSEDLVVILSRRENRVLGFPISRTAFVERLRQHLREKGALSESTEWVMDGQARDSFPLFGEEFKGRIAIVNRASLVHGETRKFTWFKRALIGFSLALSALGLFMALTLRRERALRDLRTSFVAGVSHELRTPVAAIALMAENLEENRVPSKSLPRYYKALHRESNRLKGLVEDVLDFSKIDRGQATEVKRSPLSMRELALELENAAKQATSRYDGLLEFESDLDYDAMTRVDIEALRRALMNLVENALKHSGDLRCHVRVEHDSQSLSIKVRDYGCGIPKHRRREIFAPFHSVSNTGGTGLGLAIVRGIIEGHEGVIFAGNPTHGPGSLFTITIPERAG